MKPPPRKRTKPERNPNPEPAPSQQCSGKPAWRWQRAERRKLRDALRRRSRTAGCLGDIDYALLKKHVSSRSIPEIHSVVESLKDKVISFTNFKLKKTKWEEENARKPIDTWTHMASSVAGTLEESISTAFSQMLMVSSTEPCTLRNCDPPQVYRPNTDRPGGRTVPLRPMPRLPVQGKHPGTNPAHSFLMQRTPAPTMGPDKALLPPSQVVRVLNSKIKVPQALQQLSTTAGIPPAASSVSQFTDASSCQKGGAKLPTAPSTPFLPALQTAAPVVRLVLPGSRPAIQTTQQLSEQHPASNPTTSTPKSISSGPHTDLSSPATSLTHTAPSSAASSSLTTASSDTSGKYAARSNPRGFGVKCVVDFERIYRYLSVIHKRNEESHLTAMESAIVLDLLMSLPEELPFLDCNKLHKHLIQMFQCLSSPADSKIAREMLKDLTEGCCAFTEAETSNRTKCRQTSGGTADSPGVMHSGGKPSNEAEGKSLGNSNTPRDTDVVGRCPPLNPFMVPLKLLTRRVQNV